MQRRELKGRVNNYDYSPGYGSNYRPKPKLRLAPPAEKATVNQNIALMTLPKALVERHLADTEAPALIAEITIQRPQGLAVTREFDVLVNAPADLTRAGPDSPYYAGTVAFFGPGMPGMDMAHTSTFALPLPRTLRAFSQLLEGAAQLDIRLVPAAGQTREAPKVLGVTVVPAP